MNGEAEAGMPTATTGGPAAEPAVVSMVEVVGDASAEQVAALLSVLSAVGSGAAARPARPRSRWAAYDAGVRRPIHPGPGAWRDSLRSR